MKMLGARERGQKEHLSSPDESSREAGRGERGEKDNRNQKEEEWEKDFSRSSLIVANQWTFTRH